jgi:hypothetical protein
MTFLARATTFLSYPLSRVSGLPTWQLRAPVALQARAEKRGCAVARHFAAHWQAHSHRDGASLRRSSSWATPSRIQQALKSKLGGLGYRWLGPCSDDGSPMGLVACDTSNAHFMGTRRRTSYCHQLVWLMRLLIRLAVPALLVRRLSCQPLEFTMNRSA